MDNTSSMPGSKQIHLLIDGHVQGVGFRYYVYDFAQRNGLTGWVRNRFNGQVEVVAGGSPDSLNKLIHHVRQGPNQSVVTEVKVDWSEADNKCTRFSMLPSE
jgi:acylphosphatase